MIGLQQLNEHEFLRNSFIFEKYIKERNTPSSGSEEKIKRSRFTIINYQLIKKDCLFDNIAMALSNTINDNIIKIQALVNISYLYS